MRPASSWISINAMESTFLLHVEVEAARRVGGVREASNSWKCFLLFSSFFGQK